MTSIAGDNTFIPLDIAIVVLPRAAACQHASLHSLRGAREGRFRCRADGAPLRAGLRAGPSGATDRVPARDSAGAARMGQAATCRGNTAAALDRVRAKAGRSRLEGGLRRSGVDGQG